MKNFLIALQFLTIIPIRIRHVGEDMMSRSIVYFPLVGLLLGLVLIGTDNLLSLLKIEQLFANIILVVFLIVLTGGIHLDGLADTVDALSSRKSREEMLNIMRDPRIGAMGVLGLISIILLKITFLSCIDVSLKRVALLLMCVLSRWSLVLEMLLFPYVRQEGKAKPFIQATDLKVFIISTVITLFCVIIFRSVYGLLVMVTAGLSTYIIGRSITNKIGGITGDTLGAMNELVETVVLFTICLLGRLSL